MNLPVGMEGGFLGEMSRAGRGVIYFCTRPKAEGTIGRGIGGMDRTSLGNEGALRREPIAPVARGVLTFSGQS